ncbi:uncharacterized protein PGTG_20163, partial [Puccinia graminis f. sp. tritici CRL 75-36-700-3]
MLPQVNAKAELTVHATTYQSANSSRQLTASKRCAEDAELPYPPGKSRRLEFMKYRIPMHLEAACNFLTQRSAKGYRYYTIGDYSKAANEYETLLGSRSGWGKSIEDDNLVIIQSIFNLTRCYLALGDVGKAQITLQELYDTKNRTAIGWSHSLFNELASLHSVCKAESAEGQDTNVTSQDPKVAILERSLRAVQRRTQLMKRNGNVGGAVQLISESLGSLSIDVGQPDGTLKDLLVDLHLSLAEGYNYLGQPAAALSSLKQ